MTEVASVLDMLQHVLLPLDGSEMADSVVERLAFLRDGEQTKTTLLCVIDPRQPLELTGPSIVQEQLREQKTRLEAIGAALEAEGCQTTLRVEIGDPVDTILEVAEDEECSVIAMCTHGRTGVSRMMNGSITEKVLRSSRRPVLVVPAYDRTEPEGGVDRRTWRFSSIVVALDGSKQALQIVPHVAAMAPRFGADVSLLLILEENVSDEVTELAQKHLEGAAKVFANEGVEPAVVIRHGLPAVEIVDYAARYDHDCIMMTTHGRSGISRMMLGSVAERVLRHASVPAIVVRSTADDD
jgi:nucleotide-binding universal stress UspA family protein